MKGYRKLLFLGLAVLVLISCGLFTPPAMPSDESIPTIAGDSATVTPTLVPAVTVTEATEAAEAAPTETLNPPTATPWPSIPLKKGEVVAIPAGYTLPGDSSMCTSMDASTCVNTYDSDGTTTVVWYFKTAGFARMDFGDGWAEHLEDPNQFVEAQKTDGCGSGCAVVDLKTYPDDLAEFGVTSLLPATTNTLVPAATAVTPSIGGGGTSSWTLPSWQAGATINIGGAGESLLPAQNVSVEEAMKPANLPVDLPQEIVYQAPPDDCVGRDNPLDSCSTKRLQAIHYEDVMIQPQQVLEMTGDAISIYYCGTTQQLTSRPDGDEKHDNWTVANLSSQPLCVDINAPYGSFRGWHTAPAGWTPELLDEMVRFYIQAFDLQYREPSDFPSTPVPNCESSTGCTYSNIRAVLVLDEGSVSFKSKWFETASTHWVPNK